MRKKQEILSQELTRYATLLLLEERAASIMLGCREAAQVLLQLNEEDASAMTVNDVVDLFPNVSKPMLRVLHELFETGKIEEARQLSEKHSAFICDLLELPSFGKKLVLRMRDEFSIENVEDLRIAHTNGVLEKIPGFGSNKLEIIKSYLEEKSVDAENLSESVIQSSDFEVKKVPTNETKENTSEVTLDLQKITLFCPRCYQSSIPMDLTNHAPSHYQCEACQERFPVLSEILRMGLRNKKISLVEKILHKSLPLAQELGDKVLPQCLASDMLKLAKLTENNCETVLVYGASSASLVQGLYQSLSQHSPTGRVFCINKVGDNLERLRQRLSPTTPPVLMIESKEKQIPFEDNCFDRVIWDPLWPKHTIDANLLSELVRIIKPGAYLILSALSLPLNLPSKVEQILEYTPLFALSSAQFEATISDYDLEIVERKKCAYTEIIVVQKNRY